MPCPEEPRRLHPQDPADADALARFEAHARACSSCTRRLAALRRLDAALASALQAGSAPAGDCPEPEALAAWLEATSEATRAAGPSDRAHDAIGAHVEGCAGCRQDVLAAARAREAEQAAVRRRSPGRLRALQGGARRGPRFSPQLVAAAALGLGAGLTLVVLASLVRDPTRLAEAGRPDAGGPAPAPVHAPSGPGSPGSPGAPPPAPPGRSGPASDAEPVFTNDDAPEPGAEPDAPGPRPTPTPFDATTPDVFAPPGAPPPGAPPPPPGPPAPPAPPDVDRPPAPAPPPPVNAGPETGPAPEASPPAGHEPPAGAPPGPDGGDPPGPGAPSPHGGPPGPFGPGPRQPPPVPVLDAWGVQARASDRDEWLDVALAAPRPGSSARVSTSGGVVWLPGGVVFLAPRARAAWQQTLVLELGQAVVEGPGPVGLLTPLGRVEVVGQAHVDVRRERVVVVSVHGQARVRALGHDAALSEGQALRVTDDAVGAPFGLDGVPAPPAWLPDLRARADVRRGERGPPHGPGPGPGGPTPPGPPHGPPGPQPPGGNPPPRPPGGGPPHGPGSHQQPPSR